MSGDTGWKCKHCGNFNVKTVICAKCGARLGSTSEYKDYYRILQVDPSAEQEVVVAAYKRLALKYHPDTNKSADSTKRMQELNEAYEILVNPTRRAQYDRSRSAHPSQNEKRQSDDSRQDRTQTYQPLSPEAETFNEAIELLQDPNADDRARRDAMSLLSIVVANAEQEFPLARSILAMVMFQLGDHKTAELHANIALKRNQYDFRAQFTKVQIASANMKVLKEQGVMGVLGLLSQGTATTLISGGMVVTSQLKFKDEVTKLLFIFRQLCTTSLPAVEFIYFLEQLFSIADFISKNRASIPSGKVNVYAEIANASTSKINYDDDAERKEVSRLVRLAQGYSLSFK